MANTSVTDLVPNSENGTVNMVGNSEIVGLKVSIKTAKSKSKTKDNSLVSFFQLSPNQLYKLVDRVFLSLKLH